jgi:RNA polymerase sigma-70 factor (ECF subfamily)
VLARSALICYTFHVVYPVRTDILVDYLKLEDQTLIRLIVLADEDALSALYDRYNRLVFSLALYIVQDHGAAEEITVDVFTRVWDKADTYRADYAQVNTWLTSITRYRAIDELRRRDARPERQLVEWSKLTLPAGLHSNGPETLTEHQLARERVRAALNQLPTEQRQVLLLAYFGGYSQQEIARILDQPLGTVKTRVRLGMQKLRGSLDEL